MTKIQPLFLAIAAMGLSSCHTTPGAGAGTALKESPHTAQEYYASAELRAATLSSCMATSEAEVDANLELPACKLATAAESRHQLGLGAPG